FNLDWAEVWIARDAALRLLVAEPPREAAPVPIAPAEESIFANARVSGFAWAKTWLPQLIPDPGVGFRIAPVANQGNLLGLIIIERRKGATTLAMETDQTLEEFTRELGPAWQNAQLDIALESTLEQLRQRAAELQVRRHALSMGVMARGPRLSATLPA